MDLLIIKLLLAHFIADFPLQPDSWIADKRKRKWRSDKLYLHILIHFVLTALVFIVPIPCNCAVSGFGVPKAMLYSGIIAITHYLIDLLKLYGEEWYPKWRLAVEAKKQERTLTAEEGNKIEQYSKRLVFFVDQALHLLVIFCLAFAVVNSGDDLVYKGLKNIDEEVNKIWLLVLCLLLVTVVSSHIVRLLITKWDIGRDKEVGHTLPAAGSYIGMLERLFVFALVIMDEISGIGLLITAKSVLRFNNLKDAKDRQLTEYILIGTLISFGIAALVGRFYLLMTDPEIWGTLTTTKN